MQESSDEDFSDGNALSLALLALPLNFSDSLCVIIICYFSDHTAPLCSIMCTLFPGLWKYSRLVISKSKGYPEILRDIRISTYQICRFEETTINRTTIFHKWICDLAPEVRDLLKILWKRGTLFFSPFPQYLAKHCLISMLKTRTRFSLRDKRLFEISEVEITKVDCILKCLRKEEAGGGWGL